MILFLSNKLSLPHYRSKMTSIKKIPASRGIVHYILKRTSTLHLKKREVSMLTKKPGIVARNRPVDTDSEVSQVLFLVLMETVFASSYVNKY